MQVIKLDFEKEIVEFNHLDDLFYFYLDNKNFEIINVMVKAFKFNQ